MSKLKTQNGQSQNENSLIASKNFEDFEVEKRANWWYEVRLPVSLRSTSEESIQPPRRRNFATLVLSQAYHPGWQAYQFSIFNFQFSKLEHVLVNNWENGWQIKSNIKDEIAKTQIKNQKDQDLKNNETIYIFFWPQALEFLGFGVMAGFGVWLWRLKEIKNCFTFK